MVTFLHHYVVLCFVIFLSVNVGFSFRLGINKLGSLQVRKQASSAAMNMDQSGVCDLLLPSLQIALSSEDNTLHISETALNQLQLLHGQIYHAPDWMIGTVIFGGGFWLQSQVFKILERS
eukprot:gene8726-9613_t